MPEDNRELIGRLHTRLLGSRDVSVLDEFFAPDFVSHNTPPGFPAGVEGVRRFFATFRDGLPDVEVSVDELVAEGDRVAVATTIRATHDGVLFGHPATGRRVEVTGIDVVRVRDGRIVEHRGLTDMVGLLRQLGGPE
jgi:steroid delta-isomerase-like uncharacterized protein